MISINCNLRNKRTYSSRATTYNETMDEYNMIALVDIHISHGGQPSHVSQSLRSQIPSFNLSVRWMSVMLPHRVLARSLVDLLTNPCFKCTRLLLVR